MAADATPPLFFTSPTFYTMDPWIAFMHALCGTGVLIVIVAILLLLILAAIVVILIEILLWLLREARRPVLAHQPRPHRVEGYRP